MPDTVPMLGAVPMPGSVPIHAPPQELQLVFSCAKKKNPGIAGALEFPKTRDYFLIQLYIWLTLPCVTRTT